MYKHLYNLIVVAIALPLQSCLLLNSVEPLQEGATPFLSRATVVYGVDVGAEGRWRLTDVHPKYRTFGISLDEYNIEKQEITGNCWRYNQANALVSVDTPMPQYFAFDVPAGYYVHGAFDWPEIEPSIAFFVPKSKVIYIGTFVYSKDKTLELHRDLEKDKSKIFTALPKLPKNIELADTVAVKPPKAFLCGP